jgi:alginate O-acetyltransferase complex protein AlgJ
MPDPKLPSAVIFRDSFFNGLQPFTSEHFSRVVYVSDFVVNFDLIAEENPQIVILEVAERYLNKLED